MMNHIGVTLTCNCCARKPLSTAPARSPILPGPTQDTRSHRGQQAEPRRPLSASTGMNHPPRTGAVMAKVVVQRSWPDGDELTISITVNNSFPDVVREGVRAALDAYGEALGLTVADESDE